MAKQKSAYKQKLAVADRLLRQKGVAEDKRDLVYSIMEGSYRNGTGKGSRSYEGQRVDSYEGRIKAVKDILGLNSSEQYKIIEKVIGANEYLSSTRSRKTENAGSLRSEVVGKYIKGLYEGAESVEQKYEGLEKTLETTQEILENTRESLKKTRKTSQNRGKRIEALKEEKNSLVEKVVGLEEDGANYARQVKVVKGKKNFRRAVAGGAAAGLVGVFLGLGLCGCSRDSEKDYNNLDNSKDTNVVENVSTNQDAALVKLKGDSFLTDGFSPSTNGPLTEVITIVDTTSKRRSNKETQEVLDELKQKYWNQDGTNYTLTVMDHKSDLGARNPTNSLEQVVLAEDSFAKYPLVDSNSTNELSAFEFPVSEAIVYGPKEAEVVVGNSENVVEVSGKKSGNFVSNSLYQQHVRKVSSTLGDSEEGNRNYEIIFDGEKVDRNLNDAWRGTATTGKELFTTAPVYSSELTKERLNVFKNLYEQVIKNPFRTKKNLKGEKENLVVQAGAIPGRVINGGLDFVAGTADSVAGGKVKQAKDFLFSLPRAILGTGKEVIDLGSSAVANVVEEAVEEPLGVDGLISAPVAGTVQTVTTVVHNGLTGLPQKSGNFDSEGISRGVPMTVVEEAVPYILGGLLGSSNNGSSQGSSNTGLTGSGGTGGPVGN